jgi:hypothetical protein
LSEPAKKSQPWPDKEPSGGINNLLQSFGHLLQIPAETARTAKSSLTCNPTDQKVREDLQKAGATGQLRVFEDAWHRLTLSSRDMKAKNTLADLYAKMMGASRLTEQDHQAFYDCVERGRRALEFVPTCCAAYEQLGIAYSIIQAPLSEAKRCVDEAVRLGHMTQLAPEPRGLRSGREGSSYQPSADFYFVYWRLFRADPSRKRQADWALKQYRAAHASKKSFDDKLQDLLILQRQAAIYQS